MAFKELLNAIHDSLRTIAHAALVPVIALFKAIDAASQHIITELSKI